MVDKTNPARDVMMQIEAELKKLGEADPELQTTKAKSFGNKGFEGLDTLSTRLKVAKIAGTQKYVEGMAKDIMANDQSMSQSDAMKAAAKKMVATERARNQGHLAIGPGVENIDNKLANSEVYSMLSTLLARFAESQGIKADKTKIDYEDELTKANPGRNNRLAVAIVKLVHAADIALKGQPGYREFQASDANTQALYDILRLSSFRAKVDVGPVATPPVGAPDKPQAQAGAIPPAPPTRSGPPPVPTNMGPPPIPTKAVPPPVPVNMGPPPLPTKAGPPPLPAKAGPPPIPAGYTKAGQGMFSHPKEPETVKPLPPPVPVRPGRGGSSS